MFYVHFHEHTYDEYTLVLIHVRIYAKILIGMGGDRIQTAGVIPHLSVPGRSEFRYRYSIAIAQKHFFRRARADG